MASDDELVTGEAVGLDLRPAPFVLRLLGALIDYVAYVLGLVGLVIVISLANDRGLIDGATSQAFLVAAVAIAFIVAPTAIETATRGRSLGKVIIGARVIRLDGGSIGFRHALTRALVGLLEVVGTTGGLAVIVGLLTSRSQRLGDLLAGTYALNERLPRESGVVYAVPPALAGWAMQADVARLPDSLARRMASFLRQAAKMTPESRIRVAIALATEASPYVAPLPATDPETFVVAVQAVRRDRELRALQSERAGLARLGPALDGAPVGFPRR
ncbi:putative RDD family membrane protein YckC [Frondihabitans australicus]|uniref:Putative RDD family membrane protein YckC n=2 Tax=Frondihabitans australicus TaxID=386892 RepID=A0A495IE34_9MICO|nr:putative RDD family membrane protein YckC [Frondihabitans australicus]